MDGVQLKHSTFEVCKVSVVSLELWWWWWCGGGGGGCGGCC